MANARALVFTAGGKTQEAADADTIIVSNTMKNGSGGFTINAFATSLSLQVAGTNYLVVTSAAVTAANGSIFTGSGAGLTSVPAASLTGQVAVANGGTGVSTASANTFFAGPTSGASAAPGFRAITAADLPTTAPSITGLTLWATPVAGELGYQTATAGTLAKAKADAASTSPGVVGYYNGVSGSVTALISGIPASVFFDSGLNGGAAGAPTAGQDVFLSNATAGRVTNNAPTTSAHVVLYLGQIKDATGYDNTNGAALQIWPRVGQPVLRA